MLYGLTYSNVKGEFIMDKIDLLMKQIKILTEQNPDITRDVIKILLKGDESEKHKAAVAIITLGTDNAAEIYKRLQTDEVELLTIKIASITKDDDSVVSEILEEFYTMCLAQKFIIEGGVDYAKGILERAFGISDAQKFIDKVVKNISRGGLAQAGMDKINWVKSYMPVLSLIEKEFIRTQPFKGKKIAMSIHLEAKTAYLAMVLRSGGAEVFVTGCNPLSTQDEVAAALASEGFEVFAKHGVSMEEYENHLKMTLACSPDLIIDDGGDLTHLLHGELKDKAVNLIGGCEETTTGVHRLHARVKRGELNYPMISVNDADCKYLFDNRYGTGQSTLDGIMHTTNLIIAGKNVVVAGYGWCGKGIAMRARGLGAVIYVTEIDPVKALEAKMDGFNVLPMDEAAKLGDLFITVTGCEDVIVDRHFDVMKDGVLMCNSGHFDVEIDKVALKKKSVRSWQRKPNIEGFEMNDGRILNLLAEGRLVNLAAGNGHPAEIMDMSFSIQAKSLEYLAKSGKSLKNEVIFVPKEIDNEVARLKLEAMNTKIDSLTEEQIKYINS